VRRRADLRSPLFGALVQRLTLPLLARRIFCHSDNLFWTLEQINVDQIEAPKVPSGMTGGVEHEAMIYCVRPPLTAASTSH